MKKYNLDFSYKVLNTKHHLQKPTEETRAIIALFNTNKQNRLSVLRSINFFDIFFNTKEIKRNIIRFKSKKTKAYLIYTLNLHVNFLVLLYISHRLPMPRVIGIKDGYILSFNFYSFVLRVPITTTNRAFTYKFIPLIQKYLK
jgi:hypothetical protein